MDGFYQIAAVTGPDDMIKQLDERNLQGIYSFDENDIVHNNVVFYRYRTIDDMPEPMVKKIANDVSKAFPKDVITFFENVHLADESRFDKSFSTYLYLKDGNRVSRDGSSVLTNFRVSPETGGLYSKERGSTYGFYVENKDGKVGSVEIPSYDSESRDYLLDRDADWGVREIVLTKSVYSVQYPDGTFDYMTFSAVKQGVRNLANDMKLFRQGISDGRALSDEDANRIADLGDEYRHYMLTEVKPASHIGYYPSDTEETRAKRVISLESQAEVSVEIDDLSK